MNEHNIGTQQLTTINNDNEHFSSREEVDEFVPKTVVGLNQQPEFENTASDCVVNQIEPQKNESKSSRKGKVESAPNFTDKMKLGFETMLKEGKFDKKSRRSTAFEVISRYHMVIDMLVLKKDYSAVEIASLFREGLDLGEGVIKFNFSDQVFRNYINKNILKGKKKK